MAEIVIVDDSQYVVMALKLLLKKLGHTMVASGIDGFMGVSLYKDLHPDIIALDISLPDQDVRECLEKVIEYDSTAKVIILTGNKDNNICIDYLKIGAIGYLEKPIRHLDSSYCQQAEELIQKALSM